MVDKESTSIGIALDVGIRCALASVAVSLSEESIKVLFEAMRETLPDDYQGLETREAVLGELAEYEKKVFVLRAALRGVLSSD